MNFLQIVEELRQRAGVSGPAFVTTVAQTNIRLKLVNLAAQAWTEIQNLRNDWIFNYTEVSKTLVIGQSLYGMQTDWSLTDVKKPLPLDWRIENTLITFDKSFVRQTTPNRFRERYGANPGSAAGRPTELTLINNAAAYPSQQAVQFNVSPELAYQLTFSYEMTAQILDDNDDIPRMPENYHMAIVWKALEQYGFSESAGEVIGQGKQQFMAFNRSMVSTQTSGEPEVLPCPLA
jgi:hypothetical protein